MKVNPIKIPFDGEQVVGVHPDLNSNYPEDWRQRLNNFTGRSLTHTALRIEQAGRSGRVAALGQLMSPGVVNGLIADYSRAIIAAETIDSITISSGIGIDAQGELVTLNTALKVELGQIPVYAPSKLLESASEVETAETLLARKLGPSLNEVLSEGISIPPVAILVLEPVQVEMNLDQLHDPCEPDPEQYAYENWQLIDGARLVLYSWPEEVMSLPGMSSDSRWRNQVAHSIFEYEQNLSASEFLPWMDLGVALAVIGLNDDGTINFFDRNAVVRAGGKRRRSASLINNIGHRFMWQSRFEQFNEHLVDLINATSSDKDDVIAAARGLRYLPPVGVLPKHFIDLTTRLQHFFPLSYHVEVLPIPYEQLDVVIQDSASLDGFDFNRADRVQAMVPVPQIYFEPDLLRTEFIAAEFDTTISGFVVQRNDWLGRRLEIRRKATLIHRALTGKLLESDHTDPDSVDIAELAAPFESALINFSEEWHYLKGEIDLPADWVNAAFNDSAWSIGTSGFGYNSAHTQTVLDDMSGNYVSLYGRKSFTLDTLDVAKNYRLEIITNGGFIAYLNGKEIHRFNLSSDDFKATAEKAMHSELRTFDLGNLAGVLLAGSNILAFRAHSSSLDSEQFSFQPRLLEKQFVPQLEENDYGVDINTNETGEPILVNAEPQYKITAIESLKTFFNSRTYSEDGKTNRIWSVQDIAKFEQLESNGLIDFVDYLNDKVNTANDKVDFGFVRLQTDIYRIRQFVLGNENATKLATSPVLADIAKGVSAVATKDEISRVASLLSKTSKASTVTTTPPPDDTDDSSDDSGGLVMMTMMAGLPDLFVSGMFSDDKPTSESSNLIKDAISKETQSGSVNFLNKSNSDSQLLNLNTESSGLLFNNKNITAGDIEDQYSIVGSYPIFRNATVGERLSQPVTETAVSSGRATKAETLSNILNSGLSMDGISVPGFKSGGDDISLPFKNINSTVLGQILAGEHDPALDGDESSRFNAGVRALENTASVLRLVEGRIKTYKSMISECRATMGILNGTQKQMDSRLKQIEDGLAEARHDVSVSRALRAEEQERIDGINERRAAVLEQHVPFLVFRRPRNSDILLNAPIYTLNPDLSDAPLPVCNTDDEETPEEISAIMDEIREAPIKWFQISSKVMKSINRVSDMNSLLQSARQRAKNRTTQHRLLRNSNDSLNRLSSSIRQSLTTFSSVIKRQRQQMAAIDLSQFQKIGWEQAQQQAREVISLGDIIDGTHGRMGASKIAAQELSQISSMAVCLYLHFDRVLPSIRLDWAERLSQFDDSVNLRNLYSLPRWDEVEFIQRNEMQRQVDWLFNRINVHYSDASDMINGLIRICILLASHAPVNKLISGLVPEAKTISKGSSLDVIADLSRVRIGMNLSLISGNVTVARGRVADIVGGRIKASILSTQTSSVYVEQSTQVQIGEPRATGGIGYKTSKFRFNH